MIKINKQGHRGKYSNAKTGKYIPLNVEKYEGNQLPVYKSKLEHKMMRYLDSNPNVIRWSYEKFAIDYLDMSSRPPKRRKYYIDFVAYVKGPAGMIKKIWIEVKDSSETKKPNPKKLMECQTYQKNLSKWRQAEVTARNNGAEFKIITEQQLN